MLEFEVSTSSTTLKVYRFPTPTPFGAAPCRGALFGLTSNFKLPYLCRQSANWIERHSFEKVFARAFQ